MSPAAGFQPKRRHLPRAKNACARCRKQKLRCDDVRPCALCLRVGVECRERLQRSAVREKDIEGALSAHAHARPPSFSPGALPNQVSPQESGARSPEIYRERTSTYEVVDQLFREHNSTATLHHTTDAIPGGSPETRSSEAGGHYIPISEILGGLELPPANVIELALETYTKAVHWFMLLFHKPSLQAELQVLIATGFVRADRVSFLILVVLVIGVGAKYTTQSEAQERCPGFNIDSLGAACIRKAEEKLLDVFDEANIEAVQISIILSSYYVYHSRPNRSFALLGSALKVAQTLGLHKESSWKISDPIVREVWRRLCWALYTAEVFGAISYGTPCTQDSEWDVSFPGNIDDTSLTCPGFESLETYNGETFGPVTIASYQRYKFRLYRIAFSITKNIYSKNGATLNDVVREIRTINQRLHEWEKCIPEELRLKNLKCDPADDKSNGTIRAFQLQALALQLSYDNIHAVLHRPLLTMDRVPRWPLDGPPPAPNANHAAPGDAADDVNEMIKTSKYQCWVSAMRTSTIGDHAEILAASQNTHGAAYAGIQSFTAGVVLGIFALSDPLSDQAHQAKRAMSRIIKLPRLHRFRTTVSDQCGAILEDLIRLVLVEEMKAFLADREISGDSNEVNNIQDVGSTGNTSSVTNSSDQRHLISVNQLELPVSRVADVAGADDAMGLFSHQMPELPRDIAFGNFSDALVSLQDVFRDGRSSLNVRSGNVSRLQEPGRLSSNMGVTQSQPLQSTTGMSNFRTSGTFESTTQAWIWDDLLWMPDAT